VGELVRVHWVGEEVIDEDDEKYLGTMAPNSGWKQEGPAEKVE
jgi:hypothetical protein